jgi:dienelactone hydrolase
LVILTCALFAGALARSSQAAEFEEVEVEIPNESIRLSGTLTLPSGVGPHPCVVLLRGHLMEKRDAEALGFRFLENMAHQLAQRGIAVLRCDRRGAGKSTGNLGEATLEDFADDALATVRFLKLRKEIDAKRVGLCGHSEGGWTAALAASRSKNVDFLILLATFGIAVEEAGRIQTEAMGEARGASDEEIQKIHALQKRIYEAARSGKVLNDLESEIREQVTKQFEKLPESQRPPVDAFVQMELARILSPNFRYLLDFDPKEVLKKVKCPVLAVFGEMDNAVPAEVNRAAMREAYQAGGNANLTIKVIPRANHVFMEADSGTPDEIPHLRKAFAPIFLKVLAEWVSNTSQRVA